MPDRFSDEAYVMNLLGHRKTAVDGTEAAPRSEFAEEYNLANLEGDGCADAYAHFGYELAAKVLRSNRPSQAAQIFKKLRAKLDDRYGADPSRDEPTEVTPNMYHALKIFVPDFWTRLQAAVPGVPILDERRVRERAKQWRISVDERQLPAITMDVVLASERRLDPYTDWLDWTVRFLFMEDFPKRYRTAVGEELYDFLRDQLVAPGAAQADLNYLEGLEFGHGLLLPLLSFAELDKRCGALQKRIAMALEDELDACERSLPETRDALWMRLISVCELTAGHRQALNILLGRRSDDAKELEARDEAIPAEPIPAGPTLGEWELTGSPIKPGPAAGRTEVIDVTLQFVPKKSRSLTSWTSVEAHWRIADAADSAEVAQIFGLDTAKAALLQAHLSSAFRAAGTGAAIDRLRRARLAAALGPALGRCAMHAAPAVSVAEGALPERCELLTARVLELLNPTLPDKAAELADALTNRARPYLPLGDHALSFRYATVADLKREIERGP